jgi:SAM-dependent methyltransferase
MASKDREAEILRGNARLPTAAATKGPLQRLLTDPDFTVRVVRYVLHLPVRMETEDRRVLENLIFPYYRALPAVRSVLFVGCDWYTRHYERTFFRGTDYWTLDPAPRARRFAGRRHVVGALERLDEFFPEQRFDVILCNGVYGFGLDERQQCERAFELCHSRLVDGGHFLLGWDDIPARTPVPLGEIASLRLFRPFLLPPLGVSRYVTDTPYHHTYDFYCK